MVQVVKILPCRRWGALYPEYVFNGTVVDDLVMHGARVSAVMVLAQLSQNILVLAPDGFNNLYVKLMMLGDACINIVIKVIDN